jgi:hypothetical protein
MRKMAILAPSLSPILMIESRFRQLLNIFVDEFVRTDRNEAIVSPDVRTRGH